MVKNVVWLPCRSTPYRQGLGNSWGVKGRERDRGEEV